MALCSYLFGIDFDFRLLTMKNLPSGAARTGAKPSPSTKTTGPGVGKSTHADGPQPPTRSGAPAGQPNNPAYTRQATKREH